MSVLEQQTEQPHVHSNAPTSTKTRTRKTAHDSGSNAAACCTPKSATQSAEIKRYKATPRSEDLQQNINKRINRIIGQLNGVKQMIDDNRYCGDVLIQLAAAQSALKSVSSLVLDNHVRTCVVEKIQAGDTEVVDELTKLIKKFS